MRITNIGTDFVVINESNLEDFIDIPKIHIIKMNFKKPDQKKIFKVLDLYPRTNRFSIQDNIRIYNYTLKRTSKKYYIENDLNTDIISFFRKNNKILFNFTLLRPEERVFILNHCLEDLLKNVEVIIINENDFEDRKENLNNWGGNVILNG
jgi:hypothetical protein